MIFFSLYGTPAGTCELVEPTKYISFAKKHFLNFFFIHFISRYFSSVLAELNFSEVPPREISLHGDWEGS